MLISAKGSSCSTVQVSHILVLWDPQSGRCGSWLDWALAGLPGHPLQGFPGDAGGFVTSMGCRTPGGHSKVKVVYPTVEDLIEAGAQGQPCVD